MELTYKQLRELIKETVSEATYTLKRSTKAPAKPRSSMAPSTSKPPSDHVNTYSVIPKDPNVPSEFENFDDFNPDDFDIAPETPKNVKNEATFVLKKKQDSSAQSDEEDSPTGMKATLGTKPTKPAARSNAASSDNPHIGKTFSLKKKNPLLSNEGEDDLLEMDDEIKDV